MPLCPEQVDAHWRKLGRSRKKVEYLEMQPFSGERAAYYDALLAREHELMRDIGMKDLPFDRHHRGPH